MKVLGIESTAHTLGIGIFDERKGVLSNALFRYQPSGGGILPREAADSHSQHFSSVLSQSLSDAHLSLSGIDAVAVAQGPGIGAPLSFGVSMARFLSAYLDVPIVGVNHPYAHLKIAEHLGNVKKPIIIYVSGGNTQILFEGADGFYDVLGETLDMGLGNLFDVFLREAGEKEAYGSKLEQMAKGGKYIKMPYVVKGLNISYSGLFTHAKRMIGKYPLNDIAYSLLETSLAMTVEIAERAFHMKNAKCFMACGGVAQNTRLKEMLAAVAKENDASWYAAPNEYNGDNGAMIAYAGWLMQKKYGFFDLKDVTPYPDYRIDRMKALLGKIGKI
jgi:N6-L-threonylcarbamoyladenine synthase/protein kinase Bud32